VADDFLVKLILRYGQVVYVNPHYVTSVRDSPSISGFKSGPLTEITVVGVESGYLVRGSVKEIIAKLRPSRACPDRGQKH
jgi:hypothetical protein